MAKRYDIIGYVAGEGGDMEENETGDYVLYKDYEDMVKLLEQAMIRERYLKELIKTKIEGV